MKITKWLLFLTATLSNDAYADRFENRMKACGWHLFDLNIAKFRSARARLPESIYVSVKSCDEGGPTYTVKASAKVVVIQDGWQEGDHSTMNVFAKAQPNSGYWLFNYTGSEWNGVMFVNRESGSTKLTPGNTCDQLVFSPDGNQAIVRCYPNYADKKNELYLVSLRASVRFAKLQNNPPRGDYAADWTDTESLKVIFKMPKARSVVRKYKLKPTAN